MSTRISSLCVLAGFLFFITLGARRPDATAEFQAQADSSKPAPTTEPRQSSRAATSKSASRELFHQHCVKCHGADGTGRPERENLLGIPNFADPAWQATRKDAQLLASILKGRGQKMPPWSDKITDEQARGLVAQVRAFASTKAKSGQGKPEGSSAASFKKNYRVLEEQFKELQKQFRNVSKGSPVGGTSKALESEKPDGTRKPSPEATKLFQQHCVKCHGKDGTGSPERSRQPEIPNFTDAGWQAQRSDAQLHSRILDGKEPKMPAWRGKISTEQARSLVTRVRAFASTSATPADDSQTDDYRAERGSGEDSEQPRRTVRGEIEGPQSFFQKLIGWLGKFHPPAVHFPIALLTAAAVAELLRMLTSKPAFDALSRYCVWFGTATALVAGVLGWFCGGFHVSEASWVMTTHRWLGTSTVASALVIFVLSEASRRQDSGRIILWFRVMVLAVPVLVLVTGFFGGAVVFGLDHYGWPQ